MLALAFDGITSLSVKPIRMITTAWYIDCVLSFIGVIWAVVGALLGKTVSGWASTVCIVCLWGDSVTVFRGNWRVCWKNLHGI